MDDLSEISTADLIKGIKDNPKDISFLIELHKRLDNNELSNAEMVKLLDVVLAVGGV